MSVDKNFYMLAEITAYLSKERITKSCDYDYHLCVSIDEINLKKLYSTVGCYLLLTHDPEIAEKIKQFYGTTMWLLVYDSNNEHDLSCEIRFVMIDELLRLCSKVYIPDDELAGRATKDVIDIIKLLGEQKFSSYH